MPVIVSAICLRSESSSEKESVKGTMCWWYRMYTPRWHSCMHLIIQLMLGIPSRPYVYLTNSICAVINPYTGLQHPIDSTAQLLYHITCEILTGYGNLAPPPYNTWGYLQDIPTHSIGCICRQWGDICQYRSGKRHCTSRWLTLMHGNLLEAYLLLLVNMFWSLVEKSRHRVFAPSAMYH